MKYTYEFLRKCEGLRFRATFMTKREEGIIKVIPESIMLCYGDWGDNLTTYNRCKTCTFNESTLSIVPEDFEIIPRDPDSYNDFQPGDLLRFNGDKMLVQFRIRRIVICIDEDGQATMPYSCSELFDKGYRLVLTEVEEKLQEKKNAPSLKDGDFYYLDCGSKWIFIKKGDNKEMLNYHAAICLDHEYFSYNWNSIICKFVGYNTFRKADAAEKEKLERILKMNNLCWNDKNKCLDNIFPYKKFDSVLVRNHSADYWRPAIFESYERNALGLSYKILQGNSFRQILPLNKYTIHLKGKYQSFYE